MLSEIVPRIEDIILEHVTDPTQISTLTDVLEDYGEDVKDLLRLLATDLPTMTEQDLVKLLARFICKHTCIGYGSTVFLKIPRSVKE